MKKGDIVKAKNRGKNFHPIVFLEHENDGSFSACIITHGDVNGNVKMEEEHFSKVDDNHQAYPIQYDNSYFVCERLSKKYSWITNRTVKGKLTEEGIKFVESMIPKKSKSRPNPVWDWVEEDDED